MHRGGQILDAGSPAVRAAEKHADALAQKSVKLLTVLDQEYPACLRALHNDAPPFLYVLGETGRLRTRSIAIIGTRRPTADGRAAASYVARHVSQEDWIVVSGNAPGIDAVAHAAAIEAGGATLVFPPAAMDQYVQGFRADDLAQVTVASPFVPGCPVEPWMFLRRNSLVAAHCHAAFVAETGTRGGTLDTVKKLARLRRAVFATELPETARYAEAHAMLAAGGVRLVPVLQKDQTAVRQILDAAARCLRHPAVSTPVLDDMFPEELL